MEIFINNEKIDFQLEDEKVLKDVIDSLHQWAKSESFFINEIICDGTFYDKNESNYLNKTIADISEIKVNITKLSEVNQNNLQLLYQYFSLFKKAIETSNIPILKELREESKTICKLLSDQLNEDFNNEKSFSKVLLHNIQLSDDEAVKIVLEKQISALIILLQERILELGNPLGELSKTIEALDTTEKELSDISVLLQTGKDKEAWNAIIRFSDLSQKMLRLYPILVNSGITIENIKIDDLHFSEYYSELNSILNELIEAFTSNDSVLIGDLIEYEVAPRLSALTKALSKLVEDQS